MRFLEIATIFSMASGTPARGEKTHYSDITTLANIETEMLNFMRKEERLVRKISKT